MVTKFDHPDFVGGIVWSDCELRWINEKLAAAQAREAELVAHVERLKRALEMPCDRWSKKQHEIVKEVLESTPAQSLSRLRNEVLEEAAKVCDARAMKNERAAQDCSRNGEHDEVSSLRSTAWQMSVCADAIRKMKEPEQ